MYFKSIEIENVGPIDNLKINFPIDGASPKPVIIVGENGTGKSILLSHLVNTLVVGKQEVHDDLEIDQGKVYKYRSPSYIKSGKDYSYASVEFDCGVKVEECQLIRKKSDFEAQFQYSLSRQIWNSIAHNDSSTFQTSFNHNLIATSKIFDEGCCLYFPVNRFEEPAWLNLDNLKTKATYSDLKHLHRYSNRNIISTSPLKNNRDWLLDVIFDRQTFELQTPTINVNLAPNLPATPMALFTGYSGQSSNIYNAILRILKVILRDDGNIRLGAGTRKRRQISVIKDEKQWVPDLFQLSTGEVLLLNLFLSIVRDYDLSKGALNELSDIRGIVIIDEIDSHLHTSYQEEVLPELISYFPNVQFIITSHSPLFLLGLDKKLGSSNFEIYNMPNGEKLISEDFSEFSIAYDAFKETARHREEIKLELMKFSKPIVYVEGDYDIRYLKKAAELLNKQNLLDSVQLKDGDGFGNLDKIWKSFDNPIADGVSNKIILIYDCDTKKPNTQRGKVYKRTIPSIENTPISIGIENLFSQTTIQKIIDAKPYFIDIVEESKKLVHGEQIITPKSHSINRDEKGNMCNWLLANGEESDFANFINVFQIIEEIIS